VRLLFVIVGLGIWFGTQYLIGTRPPVEGRVGDGLLDSATFTRANEWLHANPAAADGLLIASSAGIDIVAFFLLGWSIFGPSVRPFLGLFILFSLRQICQALTALPIPEGMIWRYPGFPSLLVTYGVSNDLFFSGHTALAVYGAIELARLGKPFLRIAATGFALFEIVAVLVLKAHYTMDVFAGAVTALWVAEIARRAAPWCDRKLSRR
jgi:hypothetical protein